MPTQVKTPQIANSAITPPKMAILTTKGDILAYGTDHTRLGIGANNQVLSADSSQNTGLKWSNVPRLLYVNTTIPAGNTISSSNSEMAFASSCSIQANSLSVGQVIRVTASGTISGVVSPSLILKIKYGNTILNTTGSLLINNNTNDGGWRLQQTITVTAIGSSGSVEAHGMGLFPSTASPLILSNLTSISVNTTIIAVLQITAQWGNVHLLNSITLRQLIVESLS